MLLLHTPQTKPIMGEPYDHEIAFDIRSYRLGNSHGCGHARTRRYLEHGHLLTRCKLHLSQTAVARDVRSRTTSEVASGNRIYRRAIAKYEFESGDRHDRRS